MRPAPVPDFSPPIPTPPATGARESTSGTSAMLDEGHVTSALNGSEEAGLSPPSCRAGGPGLSDCGPHKESCCVSLDVPGGTFYRSYDGVTYTDKSYPATVSPFRLDKYEVTVGRFRQFVSAVVAGWRPRPGSGKHIHLNGGRGLTNKLLARSLREWMGPVLERRTARMP